MDEPQRSGWIGKGANQFYTEMHNLVSPAMHRLRSALDDASSAASSAAQALQKHERKAGMLFCGADAAGIAVGAASAGGILNFLNNIISAE